jgi:methyl-accepting chemotaxis protein
LRYEYRATEATLESRLDTLRAPWTVDCILQNRPIHRAILTHMNDGVIQDLKQFIAATVRQEISGLAEDVSGLKQDMAFLRQEVQETRDTLSSKIEDVDAKLDTVIEATGEQLEDHGQRIAKLEAAA